MKVDAQLKIAELEQRIANLEKINALRAELRQCVGKIKPITFGEHWEKMWEEFHLMMKDIFR